MKSLKNWGWITKYYELQWYKIFSSICRGFAAKLP